MEKTNQYPGTEPMGKLMKQYAIPCIISLLVGALYNIVDQIFIANASYLGSYGNAANTVVFPLTVVALAIAVMIGDGCCAFVSIVISIVVGMAAGCIPLVVFNMGAGHKHRVRQLLTKLLIGEALVGAVALILVECFPRQLIGIFGAANESVYYTDFAIKAFRTYLCMVVLACVNKACFIFLQAMGKAVASTIPSMIREVVFGVGFALLLPVFFGLNGVLYSMPVSDALTFLVAVVLLFQTYKLLGIGIPQGQGE